MKRMRSKQLLPVLSAILLASGALAEDNLTKLGQFKTTGVTEFTTIAQDGPAANSIRNILRTIELPPGFTIDLYALVPDARHMAMAPQGTALFVGTKKEKVWVVMDRDGDNIGDEVKDFAPSLTFDIPNGVAFSDDGFLFIAERNRVMMYPAAEFFHESPDVRIKAGAMGKGLPKRDLIISQHHRMIVSSDLSSAETGSKEIFVAAKDLIGVPGIEIAIDLTEITYWHFICDQHQVVFAEGAASESLYTGPEALKMLGAEARAEIYQIFPELRDAPPTMLQNRPVQS